MATYYLVDKYDNIVDTVDSITIDLLRTISLVGNN